MNLQSKKHEFIHNSHPLIQVATAGLKICHNWIKEQQVIGLNTQENTANSDDIFKQQFKTIKHWKDTGAKIDCRHSVAVLFWK